MPVQVSYPGVYIDEFAPASPIDGVGTSTAAFIGVNTHRPNTPTLLTSWDAYVAQFTDGAAPTDDDYLWFAVRGFFTNGGTTCFVTAVSNAAADGIALDDGLQPAAAHTITVRARQLGVLSPPIAVKSDLVSVVAQAAFFEPSATVATTTPPGLSSVDVTDPAAAALFLAGDRVQIDTIASGEEATVARTSGSIVFFTAPLLKAYTNKPMKLAPLPAFCTTFRLKDAQGLVAGAVVTVSQSGATSQTTTVTAVATQRISATLTTHAVTVADGLNGFTLYKAANKPITLKSSEFTLTVSGQATTYDQLSMNPAHPRFYATVVNGDPTGRLLAEPYVDPATGDPNATPSPDNRPVGTFSLTGGADHDVVAIRHGPLPFYRSALKTLEAIADISIVAVPDCTDPLVQGAARDHCELLGDRFAILDAAKGTPLGSIEVQRSGLESAKGYAALYYPWIVVASEANAGQRINVPPSGHVAGIYARTDTKRGVHKAPAGTEATISGAIGVEQNFSDIDQGFVNRKGINVLRVFQHGGVPVVWGARTTSSDTNWQYVNIRRLFIFLEASIQQGIRGSVFEPNNTSLWKKLKRTIGAFLTQQWRDGALFGNTPEEAFYVRIDEVLNPDSERALGRLNIEIGVRPSYPAEFIVVRIGIWQGGSAVSEA